MAQLEQLKEAMQTAGIHTSDKSVRALLEALNDSGLLPRTITMTKAAERLQRTRAWVRTIATRLEIGEFEVSSGRGRLLINETEFEALSKEIGRPRGYWSHKAQREIG